MPSYRIHLRGDWSPDRLRTQWAPSTLLLPPEAEAAVARAWNEATTRPDVKLFDGPLCRLETFMLCVNGAGRTTLDLALSRTSYRIFYGTNMGNPQLAERYGSRALANPLGISALLETADGFILLGRRNSRVAYYPDRLHPFAGSVEPGDAGSSGKADEPDRPPDLYAAMYRELAEELSLHRDEVTSARCVALVEDDALRQPELIFLVKAGISRDEAEHRLDAAEHRAGHAIRADRQSVAAAMSDPTLTPVAIASLERWLLR